MKRMILGRLIDVAKWLLIILIGATAFYIVYPKYKLVTVGTVTVRINTITGEMVGP